jgi:hypothetical protein
MILANIKLDSTTILHQQKCEMIRVQDNFLMPHKDIPVTLRQVHNTAHNN